MVASQYNREACKSLMVSRLGKAAFMYKYLNVVGRATMPA